MRIGNYEILDKIGEGGFGEVFQAKYIPASRQACLKINANLDTSDSPLYMALLKNEFEILSELDGHHSIPTPYELIQVDKHHSAMAMRYIQGKTLEAVVKKHGRIHPEDVCWITERLLEALMFCHYSGVIHSDVKPSNVFVEPKKHDIKLIDFGLATYKPTSSSSPIGKTPFFAAPELDLDKPPIPETDIYGAGMVMLYALGGDVEKKSFPTDTPEKIADFCSTLIKYDPMQRPNWDKNNPIESLSDAREAVFGRRHIGHKISKT